MYKFSVLLALVALSVMAGIASSQLPPLTADERAGMTAGQIALYESGQAGGADGDTSESSSSSFTSGSSSSSFSDGNGNSFSSNSNFGSCSGAMTCDMCKNMGCFVGDTSPTLTDTQDCAGNCLAACKLLLAECVGKGSGGAGSTQQGGGGGTATSNTGAGSNQQATGKDTSSMGAACALISSRMTVGTPGYHAMHAAAAVQACKSKKGCKIDGSPERCISEQATNVATSSGDAGSSQQGGGTPSDATNMGGANGGHSEKHSESGDDGNPFATLLAEFGLTTADIGDYGAEYGDKCRGFKLVLTVNKMEETCKALDTESACEGATTCEKDGHGSCDVASAATMKAVGITFDEKKIEADVKANPAGAKDIIKGAFGQLLKPWNDKNATMKDIEKFTKQCKGKTKDACAAESLCYMQLKETHDSTGTNMVEECDVNAEKAVASLGCSGVNKALADVDAMKKKRVAAGAKRVLAAKKTELAKAKTKVAEAKKAVEEHKAANTKKHQPTCDLIMKAANTHEAHAVVAMKACEAEKVCKVDGSQCVGAATTETDTVFAGLEAAVTAATAEESTANASVKTASTQVSEADTAAKTAEQKADKTPADASALRALPSVMAVVAATVAAAFA